MHPEHDVDNIQIIIQIDPEELFTMFCHVLSYGIMDQTQWDQVGTRTDQVKRGLMLGRVLGVPGDTQSRSRATSLPIFFCSKFKAPHKFLQCVHMRGIDFAMLFLQFSFKITLLINQFAAF